MAPVSYYLLDKSALEALFKDIGVSAKIELDDASGKCTVFVNGKIYDITDNSPYPVRQAKKISAMLDAGEDSSLLPMDDIVNYFSSLAVEKNVHITRSCCVIFYKLVQLFAKENCVDERGFYVLSYSLAAMAKAFGTHKDFLLSFLACFVELGLIERSSTVQSKPFSSYTMFMDLTPFLSHNLPDDC